MNQIGEVSQDLTLPPRIVVLIRVLTVAFGIALILWAISDNEMIGGRPGFGLSQGIVLIVGLFNLVICGTRINQLAGLLLLQFVFLGGLAVAEVTLRQALAARYYSPYQLDADRL